MTADAVRTYRFMQNAHRQVEVHIGTLLWSSEQLRGLWGGKYGGHMVVTLSHDDSADVLFY